MTDETHLQGYALVSVLWLLMLLSTIAAAYHAQARVEAQVLAGVLQRTQAVALAEGAVWVGLRDHYLARTSSDLASGIEKRVVRVGNVDVPVDIADESGKINLNNAPEELLAAALSSIDRQANPAGAALVDAILDWRDIDHARRSAGAEDEDYEAAGVPHGAKDAPFATLDELNRVRHVTPTVFQSVAPLFTVYGNHARVNVAAAPLEVLAILPGVNGDEAAVTLDSQFDQRFVQQVGEDIFTASASATVGITTTVVRATVRYARGETAPIQVLGWSTAVVAQPEPEGPNGAR